MTRILKPSLGPDMHHSFLYFRRRLGRTTKLKKLIQVTVHVPWMWMPVTAVGKGKEGKHNQQMSKNK